MTIGEEMPSASIGIRAARDQFLDQLFHRLDEVAGSEKVADADMVRLVKQICGDDIADMYTVWLDEEECRPATTV